MADRTLAGGAALKGGWALGEDGWKTDMDLNLLKLSVLVGKVVASRVSADPGAPTEGECHICKSDHPTHPNKVSCYDNAAWVYLDAPEGYKLWSIADASEYQFTAASGWTAVASGSGGGGGSSVLLDSRTVAAVANIIYDNTLITATYGTYELRFEGVTPSAADALIVQVSPDNGVTWRTTGYVSSRANWGLTTSFSAYNQGLITNGLSLIQDSNTDAARPQNGSARLYGLASAAKCDMIQGNHIGKASDNNVYESRVGGMYNTAAEAHNAIKVLAKGGVATFSGKFELYGIP